MQFSLWSNQGAKCFTQGSIWYTCYSSHIIVEGTIYLRIYHHTQSPPRTKRKNLKIQFVHNENEACSIIYVTVNKLYAAPTI